MIVVRLCNAPGALLRHYALSYYMSYNKLAQD